MLKNLINQPLIHFLLIGLGLFLLYSYAGIQNQEDIDSKTVIVDKEGLLTFMQYSSKAFDREKFEEILNNMSQDELERLIDDYVREEVLYREAVGLGLETNDYVIRRRLIQKLEFINKGFVDSTNVISDDELPEYYEDNKKYYYIEPEVTFTHVFFDNEKHGSEKAQELAREKLLELNQGKVTFSEATEHGDRFPYHTNYVERTPDYIESHFGKDMSEKVFKVEPSDRVWIGPYESPYGYHLLMVTSHDEGRYPELQEVRERVKQDAIYERSRDMSEKNVNEIIEGYDVRIQYEQDGQANESKNIQAPSGG